MQQTKKKNVVNKLYHGDISLFKTVWLFGVIANVALIIIFIVFDGGNNNLINVVFMALYLAYNLIFMSGGWEAAEKYRGAHCWVSITKSLIILGYFIWFVTCFRFIDKVLIPFIVLS